jgi:asparagine synthase (glutamine-hydrolysing)
MCGIAGILLAPGAKDLGELAAIAQMTSALRHRGPDGEGFWIEREAGIAFGHRRLAIMDLSETGRQPMHSASGRHVITFNGEIYNFRELRRELGDAGHRFRGTSDTEIVLCAVETWGLDAALTRFAGMFALALWDRQTRVLHLARDRMGKKPLYVASTPQALIFASELKAIKNFPGFSPELDLDAAATMLCRGWVPDDRCIWRGAFKLPPGSILSLTAEDFAKDRTADRLERRIRRWWSLAKVAAKALREQFPETDEELTTRLENVLGLAVRQRMIADVSLGAFLSGGIDSSTVVALMQAQSSKPVRTFTIAFGEPGFDEAPYAAAVARQLGTDHTELHLSAAAARDVIPELPRIWDEPFADESQIPTLLVSQLARDHVAVALSGDGGDECFAGYSRHFMAALLRRQQQLPSVLRRMLAAGAGTLALASRHPLIGGLPLPASTRHAVRSDRLDKLAQLLVTANETELLQRLRGFSTGNLVVHRASPAQDRGARQPADLLSRILLDDMTGYLPGDILVKLDRASMARSLEGRCPLLDHRVVEFAWHLPARAKVRNGKGKWILRHLLRRYLPQPLVDRPKQGFDVPVGAWLKGPLRGWAADLLTNRCLPGAEILDFARIDTCWRDHLEGRQDHSRDLWPVLMFQAWSREAMHPASTSRLTQEVELTGM